MRNLWITSDKPVAGAGSWSLKLMSLIHLFLFIFSCLELAGPARALSCIQARVYLHF